MLQWTNRKNTPKNARMALDLVEAGNDENDYGIMEKVTNHIPEGVTSQMLYRDIVRIAWPSFLELMLTQLASMVDMMMVGQLGSWAITAVGLTTQPKFLLMIMFMAMNVGATALVARYKGEGSPEKANRILRQSLLLTFVLSIISSIGGYIFSEPMIQFMGAPDRLTLEKGTLYLKIQMVGFITLALTSTITAALRGVGNSRIAMAYNLTANAVNVIFNYLLIYGHMGFPRMEVAGASLATVIGQFVAFVLSMAAVMRGNQYITLRFRDSFKPDWKAIKSIFNIGMPAMVEQIFMRIGVIVYVKTVASLGTVAYATHQICMNIQAMSFMNGQAFAVSATSLVGQSLGKRRPDMAQAYSSRTNRISMAVAFGLALVFFFLGKFIVALYTSEQEVIRQGAGILMFVALVQPLQSSQFTLAGALRGAGDTRATAIITFITVMLIRPGLAMLTIYLFNWGLEGAWLALVADQFVRSLLVLFRYKTGKWKSIKV
ncbi:MAG TPA: MATE family efflux transporter [Clostridiales bacterium]|nr:MATE family efflux transporter [Clostridiales bacterium]